MRLLNTKIVISIFILSLVLELVLLIPSTHSARQEEHRKLTSPSPQNSSSRHAVIHVKTDKLSSGAGSESSSLAGGEESEEGHEGHPTDSKKHSNEDDDGGDSDVSEERNPDDYINEQLIPVNQLASDREIRRPSVSLISDAFTNRKSFSCPKIKSVFVTGTSTAMLSPEDIGIIAAMGDALATGYGLWQDNLIEFRGAAFPIGGDATIDGLVTVPNILREFVHSNTLRGVSHGMGLKHELPEHQLNVAVSGASSSSMPEQAKELVYRMNKLKEVDVRNTWAIILITIGTEEICQNCTAPNTQALIEAIDILNRGIHKALVVLIGPIHVSSSYHQKANLLKNRCECSREKSNEFMLQLSEDWTGAFEEVQKHVDSVKRSTFNLLALPMLTITSRYPYSLFIPNKPLLNRRGHNYAAKWLWNRLIAGPKYNLSKAVLSMDAYFCPAMGCPYFRTTDNFDYCKVLTHEDALTKKREEMERLMAHGGPARRRYNLYLTAVMVVLIAAVVVIIVGTFLYQRSKRSTRGRFEFPAWADINNRERAHSKRKEGVVSSEARDSIISDMKGDGN